MPPSSLVTYRPVSVVATQTWTLRQDTMPSMLVVSAVTGGDQARPPSTVPMSPTVVPAPACALS
jgi:hypothetical protein